MADRSPSVLNRPLRPQDTDVHIDKNGTRRHNHPVGGLQDTDERMVLTEEPCVAVSEALRTVPPVGVERWESSGPPPTPRTRHLGINDRTLRARNEVEGRTGKGRTLRDPQRKWRGQKQTCKLVPKFDLLVALGEITMSNTQNTKSSDGPTFHPSPQPPVVDPLGGEGH